MALQTPSQLDYWTFRRVVGSTLILVLIALSFWLFYRFYQVVFIVFVAIMIGTVIRPAVTRLNRWGIPRLAGAVLVYLLILVFLVGFMFLLFPLIAKQGATIYAALPDYYMGLRLWMFGNSNQLVVRLGQFLPTTLFGQAAVQQTGPQILASAGQAMGYVSSAAKVIFMTTAVLLLSLHWTLEGPRTIQSLLVLLPKEHRESTRELISSMETKVGLFIAGQGILCLAIGAAALVVYLIIGLPNALVLALVAGVMEAVPMIGPLLGAVPASLVALSIAPSKLIWVIVGTLVIQQLEGSFLVPRVMHKTVGVNPFVSLLAIFAFGSFLGIGGVLMAIPMAAIIQILLDRFVFHPGAVEPEVSIGRDYASRLRYLAQDLEQDLRKQARHKKKGSDHWVKQTDQVMDEIETITTDLDALLAQPTLQVSHDE
jgi:predicted PurR-regulated permease PerM